MFKVKHKVSNSVIDVYDIIYDKTGYPHFLIYENGRWERVSAKHYKPNIDEKKKLFESDMKDKTYTFEGDI